MKTPGPYLEEHVRSLELRFEVKDSASTRGTKVYDARRAAEREANLKKEYFGEGAADDLMSMVSDCVGASAHQLKGGVLHYRRGIRRTQEVSS